MRKIKLARQKERMILSDILPYETPVSFSNRGFYEFLIRHNISVEENELKWSHSNSTTDLLISIIFGLKISEINSIRNINGVKKISIENFTTIPFEYLIKHKRNEFRKLSIIHPRNQILAADFYEKYKEVIIYFCGKSQYSLRRPSRIARRVYWDENKRLSNKPDNFVEEEKNEENNLKSFFVYKEISNIFKFFESNEYHRCEKIYNHMAQLDVSKCFDSIYTHSITWAIHGKRATKNVLSKIFPATAKLKGTFADSFDSLMQDSNYKETNGIVIGPEISRIFSEIIFQNIDESVRVELRDFSLKHKIDYEIYRYVDDYFVFYNDPKDYTKIIEVLQVSLNNYKLSLNTAKGKIYNKPIITEVTIAKKYISDLIDEKVKYDLEEVGTDENGDKIYKGRVFINKRSLITSFKTILKNSGVEYNDALNFTFAILEKRIVKLLVDFNKISKTSSSNREFVYALSSILEFSFFIYASSPKVNTTIKLSRVLYLIISFLKEKK
ncbi:antiviral reverse transcriptase Drt3b [Halotalea alkalilenta]|uniref:antiviral reverse transcriptase Drt3b n=1 Tax=Halotalea alkalilenta TaxID=376489 RepID=UPI000A7C80C1|nr:antiviral reverse transcriptase Drt3b [Halotalea alkalilenta]